MGVEEKRGHEKGMKVGRWEGRGCGHVLDHWIKLLCPGSSNILPSVKILQNNITPWVDIGYSGIIFYHGWILQNSALPWVDTPNGCLGII